MLFTIDGLALKEATAYVAATLDRNPEDPVYRCIHIAASPERGTTLTVTSGDGTARAFPVTSVTEGGVAVVPGRLLTEVASQMDGLVTIEADEHACVLTWGRAGRISLNVLPPGEYAGGYSEVDEAADVIGTCDGRALATAISRTAPVVSANLAGVVMYTCIEFVLTPDGKLLLAATDRYRFADVGTTWTPDGSFTEPLTMLVPARSVTALAHALSAEGPVSIAVRKYDGSPVVVTIRTDERSATCGIVPGDELMPPSIHLRTVVQTEAPVQAVADVAPLAAAVARMACVAKGDAGLDLRLEPEGIDLALTDAGTVLGTDAVGAIVEGEYATVNLSARWLLGILKIVGTPLVDIRFAPERCTAGGARVRQVLIIAKGDSEDGGHVRYAIVSRAGSEPAAARAA
jgi:DNA polymerase-3 subunit beta